MPRVRPQSNNIKISVSTQQTGNTVSAKTTDEKNPVKASNNMAEYWSNKSKEYAEESKYYADLASELTPTTIDVNEVTTGEPGTDASVINVGTNRDALLNFVIPRGEKGEKGDKGDDGSSPTVIYEQSVASDTWTVQHNLNKINARVVIIDSSGNTFHPPVTAIDENTCRIELIGATTGKAYIN